MLLLFHQICPCHALLQLLSEHSSYVVYFSYAFSTPMLSTSLMPSQLPPSILPSVSNANSMRTYRDDIPIIAETVALSALPRPLDNNVEVMPMQECPQQLPPVRYANTMSFSVPTSHLLHSSEKVSLPRFSLGLIILLKMSFLL
ncbi:hypothetical protein O6H91_12G005500 [Diphasiastrum complanatum]|uniref:Uncharacterized protein n=1 Tax=Diphasiastrum complanatum TaxID=34168 RepID=A0ACC2BYK9_DIPCM|nr:hypothetical protein O6H91_12G005500 [Diphasiastrum complanatum]